MNVLGRREAQSLEPKAQNVGQDTRLGAKPDSFGIDYAVSNKRLHRYMAEYGLCWNARKISDGDCVATATKPAEGKRLMYREPAVA